MIKKIAHLADYHIHNDKWHDRYKEGNEYIYKKLNEEKPDRILIEGDLFENFIVISNEAKIFAGEFLSKLSEIAPIIITEGNHDIRKKSLKRTSSIKTIVDIMNNPNIFHYDKSGFYEDDNVVWVIHSHLEKQINPWNDIQHNRNKSKIYIDCWHDPINGCISDNGFKMTSKSYRNISDFKGNFLMAGDIHKFQYLNKEKTKAYSSSVFQQTQGESVENHGFLIWNILTETSKFIEVEDEHKLITFNIDEDFDYDFIDFDHSFASKNCEFRVVWRDYSSNINNENQEKIERYFKKKWDIDEVTWEKKRIYTNIANSEALTESVNINDKQVQQEIFKEYLLANKYDDNFIEEILSIDDIIEERLELSKQIPNVEWSIDKIWVNNFKSYEEFELDFRNYGKGVIIQAGGENQDGKTTILDAMTYITHGTTLATNKLGGAQREKHGDNRYINNKRNEDFCNGGMVIDVNGEKYTLFRETLRLWKKDKSIKSCSTTIEYFDGTEMIEENKQRGERKTNTQNMLNSIIGEFEDFIRLTLTNSENLNYLISLDRATFIDSVIRDAGYDIFEKKLAEFKDYKKEIATNKIDINLTDAEDEVKGLKDLLKTLKTEHDECKTEMSGVDKSVEKIHDLRDIEFKKLNKIDEDISNLNIDSANEKINEYKELIETNLGQQKMNSIKLKGLKTKYDKELYESLLKDIKKIDDDIINLKLKSSQQETKIEKENGNIIRVNDKIKQLKQKEIDNQKSKLIIINNDIEKIKEELEDAIEEKIREYQDVKRTQEFEAKTLTTELSNIKEKGLDKKNQIKELEESESCPTCGASPEHQKDRITKIEKLKLEISILVKTGKEVQNKLKDTTAFCLTSQQMIDDLELGTYDGDDIFDIQQEVEKKLKVKQSEIEKIDTICEEIKDGNFDNTSELETNINKGLKIKITSEETILTINQEIRSIKQEIKKSGDEKSDIQDNVYLIEGDKEEVKKYDFLMQENKELTLKIENVKLTIENAKSKIDKYYNQIKYIDENKVINLSISVLDEEITEKNDEKVELTNKLAEIMKEASVTKDAIKDIQNNVKKYKAQKKRDELLKEYQKCVSRDGLPTFLLQKSRELINIEMNDMLTNLDFDVFFDEYLNLKMYMKKTPLAIQNTLEGSGKERTFAAIVLKMALRTINNKSRPNIFLMDEVMLKLKGKSVKQFNDLLLFLKTKIDKIIIIEHVHQIPFDIMIEVEKNEDGVSSLTIN